MKLNRYKVLCDLYDGRHNKVEFPAPEGLPSTIWVDVPASITIAPSADTAVFQWSAYGYFVPRKLLNLLIALGDVDFVPREGLQCEQYHISAKGIAALEALPNFDKRTPRTV